MKVKKYVVDSLPQAMGQIKTDLGNDAMILHTKKVKTGGFLGFFGKERIEVIAAVDTNVNSSLNNSNNFSNTNNFSHSNNSQISKTQNSYNQQQRSYSQNNYSQTNSISEKPYDHLNSYQNQSRQMRNDTSPLKKESEKKTDSSITSEVSEIKKLMIKMMMNQSDDGNTLGYKKDLKVIYEQMLSQGVTQDIASSIVEKVIQDSDDNEDSVKVFERVKNEIIERFHSNSSNKEINDSTKIVHFVGPTGVGKTTTIAKLAAEKVLKQKKRIAFITADTYRIGAVDQLRTYAEILHAPIEVVFSPQDTIKAIEKLKHYDLIFMDTAGRNYHNDMYISELNNILAKTNYSETYLVLSLTHKFEDMVSITNQFKQVNIDKILFTKFDETLTYGSILNILSMFPYGVSYITHGQNVPDDIEIFKEEKIAKAILGG